MKAEDFLVTVGDGGRGFVVADSRREEQPPYVITAAHCIPEAPSANLNRGPETETFLLLGQLNEPPTVVATVLFYDPIGDIAVLEEPDWGLVKNPDAYEEFLEPLVRLEIGLPLEHGEGVLYDLGCKQRAVQYKCWQGSPKSPWVNIMDFVLEKGMSGSPILDKEDRALAVLSTSPNRASACLSAGLPSRLGIKGVQ